MHDCSEHGCNKLLTLYTDSTGKTQPTRLPEGAKWWQVLGGTIGGAYQVYGSWGPYNWQVEAVGAAAYHSGTFVGGPEFYLSITGQPNGVYFVSVTM